MIDLSSDDRPAFVPGGERSAAVGPLQRAEAMPPRTGQPPNFQFSTDFTSRPAAFAN
jgi:hypothetical protein